MPIDATKTLEPSAFSSALFDLLAGSWEKSQAHSGGSLTSPSPGVHHVRREQESDPPPISSGTKGVPPTSDILLYGHVTRK